MTRGGLHPVVGFIHPVTGFIPKFNDLTLPCTSEDQCCSEQQLRIDCGSSFWLSLLCERHSECLRGDLVLMMSFGSLSVAVIDVCLYVPESGIDSEMLSSTLASSATLATD